MNGYHTETFSAWLEPMSTDQCLWCRYSDDGELKLVIRIQVDDFLIGLADGILGERWMSEIKSLCRWGSWKVSESEFAGIRVRQHRDFSITVDLEDLEGSANVSSVRCACEFIVECDG